MTGREVALWLTCGATAVSAALAVLERARMRRGASEWWDVLVVAFGFYSGLLALVGWAWWLAGGVVR